jgi:GNAT superfamily N-acetyltransferase
MERGDIPRVAEIHVFGWRAAYRGIVDDAYLFGTLAVEKRIASLGRAFEEGREETWLLEEEGIVKGFSTMGPCRNPDKADAFELWGLYVEPLMKGAGIGSRLLRHCEDEARARGHGENCLWVLRDNAAAHRFYEGRGYAPDGKEEILERFGVVELRYAKGLA